MVYFLAEVFIPDNYLGHESMRRHESMRIRHIFAKGEEKLYVNSIFGENWP
jgi:hypothetical protein